MAVEVDALQQLLEAERACASRIADAERAVAEQEAALRVELQDLAEALERSLVEESAAVVAAVDAEHREALALEAEEAGQLEDWYAGLDEERIRRAARRVLAALREAS